MRHPGLPIIVAVLTCVLTGCVSDTYHVLLEMPPGNVARVRAEGGRPFIYVENDGPGTVDVLFISNGAATGPARHVLAGTATGRTVDDARIVEVRSGGDDASVRVVSMKAVSLIVDQAPTPARAPDPAEEDQ